MKKFFYLSFAIIFIFISCSKNEIIDSVDNLKVPILPETPYNYAKLQLPLGVFPASSDIFGFPEPFVDPIFNNQVGVTDYGATLGRVLFYDTQLSLNNRLSCGSCHHQDKAFADGQKVSVGFEGRKTTRNSMAIINPISQNNLFWDSRSKTLQDLALKPVQNHIEMGIENLDYLEKKLAKSSYYEKLFKDAFGSETITKERISEALSQFIASITTNDSKFDRAISGGQNSFSDLEKIGLELFKSNKAKCSSCHSGGNFSAPDGPFDPYGGGSSFGVDLGGATNIGLDLVYKDNGRGGGKFKIPSLRNIALTAPYMHDGRFQNLEEVIEHYSTGVKPHKDLDPKFKDAHGNVVQLNLNSIEKKALVAFLKTLTDENLAKDPKWSDPFKS